MCEKLHNLMRMAPNGQHAHTSVFQPIHMPLADAHGLASLLVCIPPGADLQGAAGLGVCGRLALARPLRAAGVGQPAGRRRAAAAGGGGSFPGLAGQGAGRPCLVPALLLPHADAMAGQASRAGARTHTNKWGWRARRRCGRCAVGGAASRVCPVHLPPLTPTTPRAHPTRGAGGCSGTTRASCGQRHGWR
jgi:hypothetical protein